MPRVGVDPGQAGDLAVDAGLLPGLPDGGLGQRLTDVDAPPGSAQLSLSERRISRISPASLVTATLTEGTILFAAGASGSSW